MMRAESSFKIIFVIIFTALLFSGCRGGTPQTEFYTLSSIANNSGDAGTASTGKPVSIGIGPVIIPEVLDRPQIVSRTGPNKLRIDEFHRWAGRLESDFARVVAENISVLLPTEQVDVYPWDAGFNPRYQITFDIQHFEGRHDQDVVLEVFWKIIDPQNKEILRFERSVIREPLTARDYDTLIAAKSQAVEKLSKLIINEIKGF